MRFETRRGAAASTSLIVLIIAAAAILASSIGEEPVFEINRFTIDAGGGMFSTGDEFDLSGTIGQSAAGVLSGDVFTLAGGFWFGQSPCDCDNDGGVNLFDYSDLDACVSGPGGGLVVPSCACFDLDADRDVDLKDVGEFQRLFSGS